MQRRSLTNSRHISTTGITGSTTRTFRGQVTRGVAATGIATGIATGVTTAMLGGLLAGGVLTGIAQAAPEPPASTVVERAPAPEGPAVKPPKPARTGKATARERRSARDAIRQSIADRGLRQVGDRYAAGAEGPDAFDCSGFTLFAWQAAGVQLTHYSAGQYQQVRRISADAAMPGDLVFYLSGGARHVALYIGDGQIVHASDYGVGVIVSPVRGTPWTNAHFTGFGRVPIPEEAVTEMIEKRRARR